MLNQHSDHEILLTFKNRLAIFFNSGIEDVRTFISEIETEKMVHEFTYEYRNGNGQ